MADTAYERILCVKNEVLVYRIPPRPSNRGYRADEWKLDSPDWTGRLRVVSKGKDLLIKLEDKNSGELFAQCPVDEYPGIAVESVMDSSRYFVIRVKDGNGRSAFIGIGFHDRADSFDLNVSIQDHFKWLKQEAEEEKNIQQLDTAPKLDLGFKEGQTITLNLGAMFEVFHISKSSINNTAFTHPIDILNQMSVAKKGDAKARNRPNKPGAPGGIGILPPPPGGSGIKLPPPAGASSSTASFSAPAGSGSSAQSSTFQSTPAQQQGVDLLLDLGASQPSTNSEKPLVSQNPPDLWGDFTSASATASQSQSQTQSSSSNSGGDWVQF